jgi:uncharacterized membrane protein
MEQVPAQPAAPNERNDADVAQNKDIAAFSYLWIMSVIVYLLRRQSPFVRYHSKQGMLLFVISLPLWFVPFIGNFLELIILGAMILGFMNAAQGQWKDVPLIGPLSRREMTVREAWRIIVDGIASIMKSAGDLAKKTPDSKPSSTPSSQPAPAEPSPRPSPAPSFAKASEGKAAREEDSASPSSH